MRTLIPLIGLALAAISATTARGAIQHHDRVNLFLGEAYRYIGDKDRARAHLSQAMHWHFSKRWRDRAASSLSQLDSPPSD